MFSIDKKMPVFQTTLISNFHQIFTETNSKWSGLPYKTKLVRKRVHAT